MSFQWNMLQLRIVVALLGGFGDRLYVLICGSDTSTTYCMVMEQKWSGVFEVLGENSIWPHFCDAIE